MITLTLVEVPPCPKCGRTRDVRLAKDGVLAGCVACLHFWIVARAAQAPR